MSYTTIIAVQSETESRFELYHTSYLSRIDCESKTYYTGLRLRRLQITQDTNKNYKLILFISISNTVKNGLVLINNGYWGELRPGCDANRLEKFMLFFRYGTVLRRFRS